MNPKVAILGAGFAGRQVAHELAQAGFSDFEVFDFSRTRSGAAAVNVIATPDSVFESGQLEKTASETGGIFAWGGQLSSPSDKNIFLHGDSEWKEHGQLLSGLLDFGKYFKGFRPQSKGSLTVRDLAFSMNFDTKALRIEPGMYSSPARKGLGPLKSPISYRSDMKVKRCELIEFARTPDGSFRLRVLELESLRESDWHFEKIVLASGTFMNAGLVSLLEKCQEFYIGNHPSRTVGVIDFPKWRWLGNLVQEMRPLERGFTTFSLKNMSQSGDSLGRSKVHMASARLIPDFNEDQRSGQLFFWRKLLRKLRFFKRVAISEYVAQELVDENKLKLVSFSAGRFNFNMKLVPTEAHVSSAEHLTDEVVRAMQPGTFTPRSNSGYRDGAHYFGTLAIGPKNEGFLVDAQLSLHSDPRVKVAGLAALRTICGIHPTGAALAHGTIIARKLMEEG